MSTRTGEPVVAQWAAGAEFPTFTFEIGVRAVSASEEIGQAVADYLEANPVQAGIDWYVSSDMAVAP